MNLKVAFGNKGIAREYEYSNIKFEHDLELFLEKEARMVIIKELKKFENKCWKISVHVNVRFRKLVDHDVTSEPWFQSEKVFCIYSKWDWNVALTNAFTKIYTSVDSFLTEGSSWVFQKILGMRVILANFKPLSGGCPDMLPAKIQRKRALLNIINRRSDLDDCFVEAVAAALKLRGRKCPMNRLSATDLEGFKCSLDTSNLSYPTLVSQIKKFETKKFCN